MILPQLQQSASVRRFPKPPRTPWPPPLGTSLKLWDKKTLQEVGTSLPGSPALWANAAFTPDGSKLVALYQDGRGFVWPATVKAWEAHACRVAGRNFTHEEWSRFGTGRSYGKTCG